MLWSSWILNECKSSCKIVKNCRIIGLNRGEKNKFCPRSVYCLPETWWEKVCLKGWFRRQDLLVTKLVEHKKFGLIFILASLLDRGMQRVNWLPPRTIVAHVFLKIIFRGCPIIHSLSNGAMLKRLVNATLWCYSYCKYNTRIGLFVFQA